MANKLGRRRVVAAWMRDDTDEPSQRFEVQTVVHFPGSPNEVVAATGEFTLDDPINRVILEDLQFSHFAAPGVMRIEGRIRRVGDQDWAASQSYFIILREVPPPPADSPPAQALP